MKKILQICLAFLLCVGLVGCGGKTMGEPQKVVSDMLNSYKNQDFDALNKYFNDTISFTKDLTFDGQLEFVNSDTTKMFLERLCDIDFEIVNEKIDEANNTARVGVKITSHNISEKLLEGVKDAVSKAVSISFSETDPEEIAKQVFGALLEPVKNSTKSVKTNITVKLVKVNGQWKISTDNLDLLSAITGGFTSITNKLQLLL